MSDEAYQFFANTEKPYYDNDETFTSQPYVPTPRRWRFEVGRMMQNAKRLLNETAIVAVLLHSTRWGRE